MTPDQFLKDSARTDIPDYAKVVERLNQPGMPEILHAVMGMVTETGEMMDALKKYLIYGKPIDVTNLAEESGDLEWYQALLLRTIKIRYEQVMAINIAKLQARYPAKFTEENALNRDLDAERAILEEGTDSPARR